MLHGKKVLLGISASIAAYKSATLARLLRKAGAEVKVVMTPASTEFITPLTMSTLTANPAYIEFVHGNRGEWNNHVELGLWADLFLLAPASAHTLSKMAHGACDNLLMAVYLSLKCPSMICPAMDLDMYAHPSTQNNLNTLKGYGHTIIDATEGELASGLSGKGRMAEPEDILEEVIQFFSTEKSLMGKKVLITAGPTQEYIDPVRYITNGSTGKMGYAIASVLANLGATVTLISGPSQLPAPEGVHRIWSGSAVSMFDLVDKLFDDTDISIFSAAVADYRPKNIATQKIKKSENDMAIEMVRTQDIAKTMGVRKKAHQINIGFALETNDEEANAQGKLERKNFDLVVLNSLRDKGAGFGHDTNKVSLVTSAGIEVLPLLQKSEVAEVLGQKIIKLLKSTPQQ